MEVKYFMWGFQPHFLHFAQSLFNNLCKSLGCDLKPTMFLVGFRQGEPEGYLPICVEPDDIRFQPEVFKDVVANAQKIFETPTSYIQFPVSNWHANDLIQRKRRSFLVSAILEAVESVTDTTQLITSCSQPVLVENYLVTLVLQVDRNARNCWSHFQKSEYGLGTVPLSLIDCLVEEFMRICTDDLSKPEPGSKIGESKDKNSILKESARHFMYKASSVGEEFFGLHGLFEACETISSLRYENAEGSGSLVIARKGHPAIDLHLTFANPVEIRDYRASRKLLELCRDGLSLICDSYKIQGIGVVSNRYVSDAEDVFQINFLKQHCWELVHASAVVMRVTLGIPELPKRVFPVELFREILSRVLPKNEQTDTDFLVSLAEIASHAKHGTMLVVSAKAKEEALRLEQQAIRIDPIKPTTEQLRVSTSIDGSVMLAPNGTCYAIGVILDGHATAKGTPSRGSRYNSAIRYTEEHNDCVVVVISEDGMIDVLPNLRPQIKKSELEEIMQRFRVLLSETVPENREYYRVMDWLNVHRFYLSESQCGEINSNWRAICDRRKETGISLVYNEFHPNSEMNESYFVE